MIKTVKNKVNKTLKSKKRDKCIKILEKPLKSKNKKKNTLLNNSSEEKYQETQYYNELDEPISVKGKYYDLFTILIKTNNKKKIYQCTIKCVYKNKKQEFNKEFLTAHEVILFFGNSSAAKKLYKKAKISTKIEI